MDDGRSIEIRHKSALQRVALTREGMNKSLRLCMVIQHLIIMFKAVISCERNFIDHSEIVQGSICFPLYKIVVERCFSFWVCCIQVRPYVLMCDFLQGSKIFYNGRFCFFFKF